MLVKGYFASCCIENEGLAMRFEEEGGSAAALLRNQLIFWSSHPQEGIFEYNSNRPLLHSFFDEALCMNIGIPYPEGHK